MVNSYLSTTFGINSHDVSEKTRFTDGRPMARRTTYAHAMALALLTQSRRAKNASGLLYHAASWAILDECKNSGRSTVRIIFLAQLDYVSRAHGMRSLSVVCRLSVCGIDYIWTYCMDSFQILVVASPGPYVEPICEFLQFFFVFFTNIFRFR